MELKVTSIELLPDVKERLIEKITVLIPLSALNKALVDKLADLAEDHPGNASLYFKVVDTETQMDVNLVARPVKLSVGRELVGFLEGRPELEFRIN